MRISRRSRVENRANFTGIHGTGAIAPVFTQRLKQSGMTWKLEGGQWIVDLRVTQLSGLWPQVYQAYLRAKMLPEVGTQAGSRERKHKKVA